MSFSVIIPSRKIENLNVCISAIRENEPGVRIIVVDDGVKWPEAGQSWDIQDSVIPGEKPFVFATNINKGLSYAMAPRAPWFPGEERVDYGFVLLNDDAILQVPGGFSAMAQQWRENPQYGLIGSSIDKCGSPYQHRQLQTGLREVAPMLVFACVFVPRATIDRIGLMDERFGVNAGGPGVRGYGCCDDDYSWRVRRAGLKLGVSDSCFVDHTTLHSTFGHRDSAPGAPKTADVRLHEKLFREKWGEDAHAWCR